MNYLPEADKWFSRYQRLRLADEFGLLKCSTCSTVSHWKEMDWGHWKVREFMGTRFDYRNGGPQCRRCNREMAGLAPRMQDYIRKTHGVLVAAEIDYDPVYFSIDVKKVYRVYRKLHNRLMLRRNEKM